MHSEPSRQIVPELSSAPVEREDAVAPTPNSEMIVANAPRNRRNLLLGILCLIAVVFALKAAQVVIVPLVMAVVLAILLSPIVTWLSDRRVPYPLGAAFVVANIIALLAIGVYYLSYPAAEWIKTLPETMRNVEWKLRDIKEPIDQVAEASKQVEEMANSSADTTPQVAIREQSYAELLFSSTQAILISTSLVIVLLYMLLASGDLFVHKLVKVQAHLKQKKIAIDVVRQIKRDVALHLFTITLINAGLGLAVALVMLALQMPNPFLWGLMAAVLNFIPYFGGVVGVGITALVAFASFEHISEIMLPPLAYAGLTSIEGYIVTPTILGKRLKLSPVVIVVGLLFWGWLWGIPGAVLTVPLLIITKSLCDRITGLQGVGEFMGA